MSSLLEVSGGEAISIVVRGGIIDGIIIGGAGGAVAGITIMLVGYIQKFHLLCRDKEAVFKWLLANTSREGEQFRSTRAIASHTNLTEDRVRYVCSVHDRILMSTGEKPDMWSPFERDPSYQYFGM